MQIAGGIALQPVFSALTQYWTNLSVHYWKEGVPPNLCCCNCSWDILVMCVQLYPRKIKVQITHLDIISRWEVYNILMSDHRLERILVLFCSVLPTGGKNNLISSSNISFTATVAFLSHAAAPPPPSVAAFHHNRDLSSGDVSFDDNGSGRIMQFFPSSQHGEAAAARLLVWAGWVGGQLQKQLLCLSSAKGASLSATMDVFTKSGPKGDPVSACGWRSFLAARLHRAANIRHNNAWQSAEAAFKGK